MVLDKVLEKPLNEISILHCPHCQVSMKIVTIDGIEIDVCTSCSGIWFDKYEVEEIIGNYAGFSGEDHLKASIIPFPFDMFYILLKWFSNDSNNKKLDS